MYSNTKPKVRNNMTRNELEALLADSYGSTPEYPFERYPSIAVFRHGSNNKWFAAVMRISKSKLGIADEGKIDIVNLKCPTEMIDSLWQESGIYPAYHMSKAHWLSVCLDESAPDDTVKWLLEISYNLTKPKNKRCR